MRRVVKLAHIRIIALIVFGVAAAAALGSSFAKLSMKKERVRSELARVEQAIADIQKDNEELEKLLGDSDAASVMLEKEARRRLNLKKPGEKLIIIVPPKTDENKELRSTNQELDEGQSSWWQKIFTFLRLKK